MKADEFLEVLDGINLKYINEVLQPASRKTRLLCQSWPLCGDSRRPYFGSSAWRSGTEAVRT